MRRSVRRERRVGASTAALGRILADVAGWERWMPFLHSLEMLRQADGIQRLRVATPLLHQGRPFEAEVIPGRRTVRFRELADGEALADGLEGRWTWSEDSKEGEDSEDAAEESGDATRVEVELSVDRPLLQFRTRVHLERAAEGWLDALASALGDAEGDVEIYRTPDGELQLRRGGRTYRLVAEGSAESLR